MGAMYMHIDCVYRCYIHVCLIRYMGAIYMYSDRAHGCYVHVY